MWFWIPIGIEAVITFVMVGRCVAGAVRDKRDQSLSVIGYNLKCITRNLQAACVIFGIAIINMLFVVVSRIITK